MMNEKQKAVITLIVQYANAEDWASIKVLIQGEFLDVFDSINSDLLDITRG
jgi:hypothetical protein